MPDSQEQLWSDNPNGSKIPHGLYLEEKSYFVGILIASILYGIIIVLFFQCMAGLFNSVRHGWKGVKWGLVSYTTIMFSFATVFTVANLNIESISYIDNREFPGGEGASPPGPLGYQWAIRPMVLSIISNLTSLLNYWLADGLLLHRCYVIYSVNPWAIAFPCLAYLASIVAGVMTLVSEARGWGGYRVSTTFDFGLLYLSISVSLNVLLTLMIVTRLILHGRNIRVATGSRGGISGLYKVIATMFIESSALYAVSSLLAIGLWVAGNHAANAFLPILAETQVIAPLLIIRLVANQSAFASDTIVTGHTGSSNARTQEELISGDGTPDWISIGRTSARFWLG